MGRVRKELREIERLRGAARVEVTSLKARRAELRRHRETVTGKLETARRLLSRLTAEERARDGDGTADRASRTSSTDSREGLSAAAQAPDSRAAAAVAYAYQKLGSPYVWARDRPARLRLLGPHPGRLPRGQRLPAPHDLRPDRRGPPRPAVRTPPR
ncbi:hypothetical protein SVIOM342S_06920 [Streptomyces violaceorubidus]